VQLTVEAQRRVYCLSMRSTNGSLNNFTLLCNI
jgi:hypothetical protein